MDVTDFDERSMHLFIEFRLLGHVALKNLAVQPKILVSTKIGGLYPRRVLPYWTFLRCASFQLLGVSLKSCGALPIGVCPVL